MKKAMKECSRYAINMGRNLLVGATTGLVALVGGARDLNAEYFQFTNQGPVIPNVSSFSANIVNYDYPGVSRGYDSFDQGLDTSISPDPYNFVAYFPLDNSGRTFNAETNFIPSMRVGDNYTAYLGFENRSGVDFYGIDDKVVFAGFDLSDNSNGVEKIGYQLKVDTDINGSYDYVESGLFDFSGQETGGWAQDLPSGMDWRSGQHYGELTFTAIGEPQPVTHSMSIGFNPLRGGEYLGVSEPLVVTYGEDGATSARGDVVDESIGWGSRKFKATAEGDYGVYSREMPFGSGETILGVDSRPIDDPASIFVETYTNKISPIPNEWIPGETWNEGGLLEFDTGNDPFFKDFTLSQMDTASFNQRGGLVDTTIYDADMADGVEDGKGVIDFGRVGWLNGGHEFDFWVGPHSSFLLTPGDGSPWDNFTSKYVIESGAYAVGHTPTPEPSTLVMLGAGALALGAGVLNNRRKKERSLADLADSLSWEKSQDNPTNF